MLAVTNNVRSLCLFNLVYKIRECNAVVADVCGESVEAWEGSESVSVSVQQCTITMSMRSKVVN